MLLEAAENRACVGSGWLLKAYIYGKPQVMAFILDVRNRQGSSLAVKQCCQLELVCNKDKTFSAEIFANLEQHQRREKFDHHFPFANWYAWRIHVREWKIKTEKTSKKWEVNSRFLYNKTNNYAHCKQLHPFMYWLWTLLNYCLHTLPWWQYHQVSFKWHIFRCFFLELPGDVNLVTCVN